MLPRLEGVVRWTTVGVELPDWILHHVREPSKTERHFHRVEKLERVGEHPAGLLLKVPGIGAGEMGAGRESETNHHIAPGPLWKPPGANISPNVMDDTPPELF